VNNKSKGESKRGRDEPKPTYTEEEKRRNLRPSPFIITSFPLTTHL